MNRASLAITLLLSAAAWAHGGGAHFKGSVSYADEKQLTVTTEEKKTEVVTFNKDTRFESDGKPATAKALVPGLRVVVHLKAGVKPQTAALVKFSAGTPVRVLVEVTKDGFVVANAPSLKAGTPVTRVVTRTVDNTCATDIVLKEFGLSAPLPLGKPVEVTFVPSKPGKVHFACAMDMFSGELKVE